MVQRWIVHSVAAGTSESCVSYDLVSGRTHDGRTLGMLTLIDEYTRACDASTAAGDRRKSIECRWMTNKRDTRVLLPIYLRGQRESHLVLHAVRQKGSRLPDIHQ